MKKIDPATTVRVTLDIPKEIQERMLRICQADGSRSIASLVRVLLAEALDAREVVPAAEMPEVRHPELAPGEPGRG